MTNLLFVVVLRRATSIDYKETVAPTRLKTR